ANLLRDGGPGRRRRSWMALQDSSDGLISEARRNSASRSRSSVFITKLLPQLRECPARLALDGAEAAPQDAGGLSFGPVLVVPQHHACPLPRREPKDGVPHRVPSVQGLL